MRFKHLLQFVCFVCFTGCAGKSQERIAQIDQPRIGLSIENGPRQGMQYFDTANVQHSYRYFTMTVTNDTTIATKLEIGFSQTEIGSGDSGISKIFILPRHLTPKKQQMDIHGISKELKHFLDCEMNSPVRLNKIIGPTEKCVVTFGVLTNVKFQNPTTPYGAKLLTSNEGSSKISFELQLNDTLIIPCGHFTYIEK